MISIHALLLIAGLFGAAIGGFLAFPMFGISGRDSETERRRKDLCDYGDARWREGYRYGYDVATASARGCSVDTLRQGRVVQEAAPMTAEEYGALLDEEEAG